MIKKVINKNSIFAVIIGVCLILISSIFVGANIFHYENYMDSDVAADTLLTEVLSQNNYMIPDNWYGSTEKCYISAPNFAAFLYPVLGNLNLSMGIVCSVMFLILLVVMLLYYRKMQFGLYATLIATIIPMVLSRDAHNVLEMIVLYAAYYVSHLIVMFIVYNIYGHVLRIGRVSVPVYVISIILAILGGLQGMHVILFAYAPIVATEVFRLLFEFIFDRKIYKKGITIWTIVLFVISYFVTNYTGSDSSNMRRNIRHSIEKFTQIVLPQIKSVITIDGNNMLFVIILCILGLIGYALLIRDTIKETRNDNKKLSDKWAMIPFVFSVFIMIFALTFTVTESATRYYIMQMFIIGTGVGYLFRYVKKVVFETGIVVVVTAVAVLSIVADYRTFFDDYYFHNTDRYKVVCWLEENDYTDAYAIFDVANMLTIISNNQVHVRSVDNMNDLNPCKWLSYAEWYRPYTDKNENIAYIVTSDSDNESLQTFLNQQEYDLTEYTEIGVYKIYVINKDFVSF